MDYVFLVLRNGSPLAVAHSAEKGMQIVENIIRYEQGNGDQLVRKSDWIGEENKRLFTEWRAEDMFTFSALYEVQKEIVQ